MIGAKSAPRGPDDQYGRRQEAERDGRKTQRCGEWETRLGRRGRDIHGRLRDEPSPHKAERVQESAVTAQRQQPSRRLDCIEPEQTGENEQELRHQQKIDMPLDQTVTVFHELRQVAVGKKHRYAENPGRDQRKNEQEAGKSEKKGDAHAPGIFPDGKNQEDADYGEADQRIGQHALMSFAVQTSAEQIRKREPRSSPVDGPQLDGRSYNLRAAPSAVTILMSA
ncbi:hypothetical protein [Methylocystis heyeri]|uniref:Uncharacterized protein n=1 Tax=Methylocystis heyeri TaxID=391905 RepID=A0A6B8KDA6_9HYPH|nr:hypothetical protein [Methylocystis heyeri]QGM46414.1 hypothetical protein H2LOC_012305 [Methylocystis heyeri]